MKSSVRVHRVNFYQPEPKAIRCLEYDNSISHLAVSRADSSIEIWDVAKNPFLEKVIPGSPTNSVETLSWCNGRLFSAGLYGYITEYDLTTLVPKYQIIVTSGSPIWCMSFDKQKTCLAVGNEDGHVVLHDLSREGLYFQKKFDKQEGCILCLAWHKDGRVIVTGSLDIIRVWNVQTGHVVNRIILGRAAKHTPTIVWCIAITSDMTIVSGDSCGKTSFWDGNKGTLLSSVGVHKDDVLALCVNEDEDVIYTTGVDPMIVMLMKYQSNGKWLKSAQRIVHTHDVRALQILDDFLASGGDDCNLVFTKYPPKTTIKYFPFCQMSYASVASDASCILLRYPNYLEIWKIGLVSSNVSSSPVNLLQIKAKANEGIICSAISNNGKWVAYSSQLQLKVYKIDTGTSDLPSISKIELPGQLPNVAGNLLFTLEPTKLIFYSQNRIFAVSCAGDSLKLVGSTLEDELDSYGQVHLMELSPDNEYLACGCYNGNVVIYRVKTLKLYCKLPLYKYQATALKFDPTSENLIVVYTDRKVVEYSLQKFAYTLWTKQKMLLDFQASSFYPIISIVFNSDKLFFQDENCIYIFEKSEQQLHPAKKKLKNFRDFQVGHCEDSFTTVTKYEHISSIHSFSNDIVVVQISPNVLLDSLPPPIWKKKYGT